MAMDDVPKIGMYYPISDIAYFRAFSYLHLLAGESEMDFIKSIYWSKGGTSPWLCA